MLNGRLTPLAAYPRLCTALAVVVYNPNRIPVHSSSSARFASGFAGRIAFEPETNVECTLKVWYTDSKACRGFQHKTVLGFPAFWKLQRGTYHFGWTLYRHTPAATVDLVRNGSFGKGLQYWASWGDAVAATNLVKLGAGCVRIESRSAVLSGLKQHIASTIHSGQVFRLSASARNVGRADAEKPMGTRVTIYMAPGVEYGIACLSQRSTWTKIETVFTNDIEAAPIVVLQMGYGKIVGAAEFTDVKLEPLPATTP